jgi:hypothetical protein
MVRPAEQGLSESLQTREAIAIIGPIADANPKSASMAIQLADAREYAGQRLRSLRQMSAAAEQYRKSLATIESRDPAARHFLLYYESLHR